MEHHDDATTAEASDLIEVHCLSCGRTGRFARGDHRLRGEPLSSLTRRFLCSACGSRAVRAQAVGTPCDLAVRMGQRLRRQRG